MKKFPSNDKSLKLLPGKPPFTGRFFYGDVSAAFFFSCIYPCTYLYSDFSVIQL
ncbi:MAG: hypothetical protein HY064_05830 [Bacteroidetes bacterium]|nr:hypothetical protein [Bacteroidota bacterium]